MVQAILVINVNYGARKVGQRHDWLAWMLNGPCEHVDNFVYAIGDEKYPP